MVTDSQPNIKFMSLRTILTLLHLQGRPFTVLDIESVLGVAKVTGFGKIKKWLALGWVDRDGYEGVTSGARPHSRYVVTARFVEAISEVIRFREIDSSDLVKASGAWKDLTVSQLHYLAFFRNGDLTSREFKAQTAVSEALGRRTLITLSGGGFIVADCGSFRVRAFGLTALGRDVVGLIMRADR